MGLKEWAEKVGDMGSLGPVVKAADEAAAAGHTVFTCMLGSGLMKQVTSISYGADPGDWSRIVSAVESRGWRLEQWEVVTTLDAAKTMQVVAFPVFRRTS